VYGVQLDKSAEFLFSCQNDTGLGGASIVSAMGPGAPRHHVLPAALPACGLFLPLSAGQEAAGHEAGQETARRRLPFRAVNRRDAADYDPGLQRHHLLPRQLLQGRCFGTLFEAIGRERLGFDDFRANGLLLPATDAGAARIGLPLHRGPHRDYNAMVTERVGQVEADWSCRRLRAPEVALSEALARLRLLQRALRRRLLDPGRRPLRLNRAQPVLYNADFAELDALADSLWGSTQELAPATLVVVGAS